MLTIAEAAARAGVTAATWRSYVARDQAPKPDEHDRWGHPMWSPETIDTWLAARRGRGWRKGQTMNTYACIASCSYRDEVRRYDIPATSWEEAATEAARRYGHESTIGVDVADVTVEPA